MMEYFTSLIVWILAVYGTTNIIVFSMIFKPIREYLSSKAQFFSKLVVCPLCMGFWVGALYGLVYWNPSEFLLLRSQDWWIFIPDLLFNGTIGSCVSWLIYLAVSNKMQGK
jgi:L-cystine uptake protein TcyP (sodium:dicarboxylate symporter family)